MPNHIERLLAKVLKAYNVPVSKQTIEKTMQTHPTYISMQTISTYGQNNSSAVFVLLILFPYGKSPLTEVK